MRIKLFAALAPFVLSMSLGGCILHTNDKPNSSRHASKSKQKKKKNCRPSQYWDGSKCKHKGKGKGARKHDGR